MMQTERDLESRLRRDAAAIRREVQPDAGFHYRIMARVSSTTASPASVKRSFRLPGQLAFAAAFMVIALALGLVFSRLSTLRPAYRNDGAPPLVGMMIAADPARHQVVLFGGGADFTKPTSDTWTWDGSSWTQRHPSSSPPARSYPSMAYDAARHTVVIFGGMTAVNGPSTPSNLNDTWLWNGTTWKEARSAVVPPPTNGAAMAYDPALGQTVLLDAGFTWTWDGVEWSKRATAPPGKALAKMVYDPASGTLVVLAVSQATMQPRAKTPPSVTAWHFDGRTWTEQPGTDIPLSGGPAASWPILIAEDPLSGSLMGVDQSGRTWSWDGTRWTPLNAKKVPAGGGTAAITYDPSRHLVLLFGGQGADGRVVSDLSVWDGKQWTLLQGGEKSKTLPRPPGAPQSPRPPAAQQSHPTLSLGVSTAEADWLIRGVSRQEGQINALYQSVDGGRTWQKRLEFNGIYDGMSWSPDGNGLLWSIDWSSRGCSGASSSCAPPSQSLTVYVTADGGHQWTARAPTAWPAFLVYFRGLEGWATSMGGFPNGSDPALYHTTDGGASWAAVGPVPGGLRFHGFGVGDNPLEFVSSQRGWFATRWGGKPGDSGLFMTTDGGHTWVPQTVQPPVGVAESDLMLGYPELLSDGKMLLPAFVCREGDPNCFEVTRTLFYSSSDGGITWANPQLLQATIGMRPTDESTDFFLDSVNWWFTVGGQPLAGEPVPQASETVGRTTDGGKTWQVFTSPGTIVQLRFTDAVRGWASAVVDNTNVLLRTTDGGAHWQRVQLP